MNTADEIRHLVVVARLTCLQEQHNAATNRLTVEQQLVNWLDWEMSDLWIEKAALERTGGYPRDVLFT